MKRGFSVLDDNSPGMRDVKAYYDGQRMARAAAVEKDIAREPVEDWQTFINLYKDEDRKNQTRIDEQHTRHFMEGASWNNEYHIQAHSRVLVRPLSDFFFRRWMHWTR